MPSITTRLTDASERLSEHGLWLFAVIPLLSSILGFSNARKLLAADISFHVGITFGFPLPVTDPWSFVSTSVGGGAQVTGPATPAAIGLLAIGIVIQSILLAGYLGGVRDGLRGEHPDFVGAVQSQFVPFLGFSIVLLTLAVPPMLFALASGSLTAVVLLWLPVYVLISYLFYATPYLIVLHDVGLGRALRWSLSLATGGGEHLRYALGYAVLVAVVSVPATVVVANLGVLGILLGIFVLSPVGLVFDTATLLFIADSTDVAGLGTMSAGERRQDASASLDPDADSAE